MIDPIATQSIQHPYSSLQYLNNLQAYNCNVGVNSLLDLLREIQESGNYYYQGLVFPNLDTTPRVLAQQTINGTFTVPPGTYVTGIAAATEHGASFKLKLFDKGSKASIFYGDYALQETVAGLFGTVEDTPTGPALLKSPFIITGPGVIGWEIVNLSSNDNRIQVLIDAAVPITNRSINNIVVNR